MVQNSIVFLGTGGGRVVVANQLVATGGFVVQLAGWQVHVDPGPGALVRAKQFGVRATRTDVIFVSHHHVDHSSDINAISEAITLGGIYNRGLLISTKTVIDGTENNGPCLYKIYRQKLKQCSILKTGDSLKFCNLNFIATPTKHDVEENIGLKLEGPGVTIGYTSDTAYFPELKDSFMGCDILLLNVLRPGTDRWKTHMSSEDAAKLISEVKPRLAIIQHYGAKLLRANPLYEAREIQRKSGVRTIAATDGMRIDLKDLHEENKGQMSLQV
jgi:ribonuclease BN (tRNA processing enzyme)